MQRLSYQPTCFMIQPPAAGAASRSPTNPLMRLSVGEGLAPPETFPIISLYHAEHINLSVGYGACDVPNLSAPSRSHAEQISASVGMFLSRRRHLSVAMRHLPLGEITLVIRSMPRGSVIENVR